MNDQDKRLDKSYTDIEFTKDFVHIYEEEKDEEVKNKEKRKGIQSIPFYRNG